jgi:hypothetical protein
VNDTEHQSAGGQGGEDGQRQIDAAVHEDALPAEDAPEALEGELYQPLQVVGGAELSQVFPQAKLADDDLPVALQTQEVRPAVDRHVAHVPGQGDQRGGEGDARQVGQDVPGG